MATLKQANLDPVSWPRMIRAVEKVRERLTRAVRVSVTRTACTYGI